MARLEVTHLADRAPGELSGGETQRVLLAAMLAVSPAIWLLDEPFSALDHASRSLVGRLCIELAGEGATVLIACDDADVMAPLADRLVVFARGTVALDGHPAPLLANDAILSAGAGTTDAASLAAAASWSAPRPIDTPALLSALKFGPVPVQPAPSAPNSVDSSSLPILALEGVGFGYRGGPPVLSGLSLAVRAGEAVGLFGPNGAGKSTVLRLGMALEQPTSGTVRSLDRSTKGLSPEDFAPRIGFLFQQPERQLFATTVRGECAVALQLAGWSASRTAEAVAEVLEELGLAGVAEEHPYDLPLPSRRLVALASILVARPELVLLDEPTAGLDGTSRERVIRVIQRRVSEGLAALVITHDAILAHESLGRALQLREGMIVADGSVRDVLDGHTMSRPAALAVAMELGMPIGQDRQEQVAATLTGRDRRMVTS
jgi:energy-coupling factor transport system ATP-binding protein